MESTLDKLSRNVPRSEGEYVGQNGLTYCKTCGQATQTIIEFMGIQKKVRCICECIKKEMEADKERERQEELARKRRACFAETNMASWTFANDDIKNPKLSAAMRRYVENFSDFEKEGKGLLLYGTVGTGKTYFAACIANALIEEDYSVLMTDFARLTNKIQGMHEGKQEYIDSLNSYSLLIIDDLGIERKTEFMQEMVYNVINSRYKSGLPFIITTNLTADEIKKPQDVGYARIYDRILERCFPVKVEGESRRRQNVKDTFFDVKDMLGL
jgi:DNA replication protein DnaC